MAFTGDNTDGIGLLSDLERTGFIKPRQRILLVALVGHLAGSFAASVAGMRRHDRESHLYSRARELALFAHTGSDSAREMDTLSGKHSI